MSDQELDKLFKSKLGKLDTPPTSQAWEKLHSQLAKKDKKKVWVWWNIAAAILLLGVITILIAPWESKIMIEPIVQNDSTQSNTPKNKKTTASAITSITENNKKNIEQDISDKNHTNDEHVVNKKTLTTENVSADVSENMVAKESKSTEKVPVKNQETTEVETAPVKQEVSEPTQAEKIVLPDTTPNSIPETSSKAEQTKQNKHIVIEYTLNANTPIQAPVPDNPTDVKEEQSKSKNLLELARESTKKIGIGSLREAKNNLLSFKKKNKNADSK